MDFSLSPPYDFQRYINNHQISQNKTDSFRNINNFQQLQLYFNNIKQTNMLKIYSLQQRLNQCFLQVQSYRQQLDQKSQNQTQDKIEFQLQRYQDLLHYNFKEIQWAQTQRMSQRHIQIPNNLQKFENMLSNIEQNMAKVQKQQENLEIQFQTNLKAQLSNFMTKIDKSSAETTIYQNDIKICIHALNLQCQTSLKNLELKMKDMNDYFIKKIDIRMKQIQDNIQILSKK